MYLLIQNILNNKFFIHSKYDVLGGRRCKFFVDVAYAK